MKETKYMDELDRMLGLNTNRFSWENHAEYLLNEMNKEVAAGFPEGIHSASVLFDDYCEALENLGKPIPQKPLWYNRLWWPGDL